MGGRIERDMSESQYHSDPALSATGAKQLLKSAAKYKHYLTHRRPEKREYDLGSAVHLKVLGKGYDLVMIEADDFRTKVAQEARDAAYAAGKVPMLRRKVAQINGMAEAALAQPDARKVLEQSGDAEVSYFAEDPDTGVRLRCRWDYMTDGGEGVDLKTTGTDADPETFARTVYNYGYDLAHGHYTHVGELVLGVKPTMTFLVVEVEPPYLVGFYELDNHYIEIGDDKAKRARERFAECLETGVWPGYPERLHTISPPMFAIYEFMDNNPEEE